MARSPNYCCYYNASIIPFFIVGVKVAFNNNVFIVAMEMQQWVPFVLLSYKTFRNDVKTTKQ